MIIIRFVMAVFCDQPSRVTLGIFRKEKGCNRKKYKRAARGLPTQKISSVDFLWVFLLDFHFFKILKNIIPKHKIFDRLTAVNGAAILSLLCFLSKVILSKN